MNHCVPLRKAPKRFDLMFRRTVSSLTLRYDAASGTVNSEHPHGLGVPQPGGQVFLQPPYDCVIGPPGLGEKTLHRPGGDAYRFREIFGVAPLLGLHQQGLKVIPAVLPPLLASVAAPYMIALAYRATYKATMLTRYTNRGERTDSTRRTNPPASAPRMRPVMPYIPLDWSSAFGGFCSTLLLGLFRFGTCRLPRPLAPGFLRFPSAISPCFRLCHSPSHLI